MVHGVVGGKLLVRRRDSLSQLKKGDMYDEFGCAILLEGFGFEWGWLV